MVKLQALIHNRHRAVQEIEEVVLLHMAVFRDVVSLGPEGHWHCNMVRAQLTVVDLDPANEDDAIAGGSVT